MDTIELTTTTTAAGLPDVVQGIAAAVGARDWLALSGWIIGALLFIADWTDVLRFFSGVGRTVAVASIATAIAWAAAAVLPGTTLAAVVGAALMAGVSAALRPPALIEARFDRRPGER